MAYSEKVVEHYENPRNVGSFDKGDESVGTGMVGALHSCRGRDQGCGGRLQEKARPLRLQQTWL